MISHDLVNMAIHIMGLGIITIMHYPPKVKKVAVTATKFTVYPYREETDSVRFYAEIYDVPSRIDYWTYSTAYFVVDIYKLMKQLNIKVDLDPRY